MHTLFNREHNRIAAKLATLNPTYSDETLYQETRRIVIAEYQHVVFNEFVPIISGNTSLSPLSTESYYTGYDSTVNKNF
jgi:peroxidase